MYFEVQNDGMYERMKWPIIIRSTGMMLLYSLISTIANQRMPYRFMSTWVCIMLTVRMVIAPCIGSALYTNVLQHRQQYYVTRFAQDYDRTSMETAKTYDQTVRGMQYQGKSVTEAQNMAAMSTKGKVQVQATLVSHQGDGRLDLLRLSAMCRTDARSPLAQAQYQGTDARVSAEECRCEIPGKKVRRSC